MCQLDEIRAKRRSVYRLAKKHKAERLYVFGSCARREEGPDSDIDFLVRFRKGVTLFDQAGLICNLKKMFKRDVDVVPVSVLKTEPWFANEVMGDLVAI